MRGPGTGLVVGLVAVACAAPAAAQLPEDRRTLSRTVSYAEREGRAMRRNFAPVGLGLAVVLPQGAAGQQEAPVAEDFVLVGPPPSAPEPLASALRGIGAEALAAHVAFLASPALEGRGLGSRGLDAAAEYAAAALAQARIPPLLEVEKPDGGHARYFQPVPIRAVTGFSGELAVETTRGPGTRRRSFSSGADCVLSPLSPGSFTAPVVFAAYGIREPRLGRDDYAGLDVRGKAVLVLRGVPEGDRWRDRAQVDRYDSAKPDARWEAKGETAQALGAVALLAAEGQGFANDLAKEPRATRFFVPLDNPDEPLPVVRLSPTATRALLAGAGLDAAAAPVTKPRDLPGVAVTVRVTGDEALTWSRNVIGVLAGSDERLREQAVVLGAHLDHLGRAGVPFVRFFGSFFPGYHGPADRPESLDSTPLQRMARLALATAWRLAER